MKPVLPALLVLLASAPAMAAEDCLSGVTLKETGIIVQRMSIADAPAKLECRVSLGSDVPQSTFVIAYTMTNKVLKRDVNGFWHGWDNRRDSLTDTNFYDPQNPPADRKLLFKIINEEIAGTSLPVSFHFGYLVGGKMKYGVIAVEP